MTKKELIQEVASQLGFTKKDTDEVINTFLEIIQKKLESGEKVVISGFGTFDVKTREARQIPNPVTGEKMDIPARKAITFKAAKAMLEELE